MVHKTGNYYWLICSLRSKFKKDGGRGPRWLKSGAPNELGWLQTALGWLQCGRNGRLRISGNEKPNPHQKVQ